jgi:hypothetical protein
MDGLLRLAKEYGGTVDARGQIALPTPGMVSGGGGLDFVQKYAELQRKITENASHCGFRCTQCGKVYCLTCLSKDGKTHPVSGGKACFACGANVKAID